MTTFLTTQHLQLESPCEQDYSLWYELQSDPEVMRFIGHGARSPQQVHEALSNAVKHYKTYGYSLCSVFESDSKRFLGRAGVIHLGYDDRQTITELACILNQYAWHKAYALELKQALVDYAFSHLACDKLVSIIHPENQQAIAVLQSLGMHLSGIVDYRGFDVAWFELYHQGCS